MQAVPESEQTPAQTLAVACAEAHGTAFPRLALLFFPQPECLVPSTTQRDAYLLAVEEVSPRDASAKLLWKIGRSDDPLTRASGLRAEVKRERGFDWQHEHLT